MKIKTLPSRICVLRGKLIAMQTFNGKGKHVNLKSFTSQGLNGGARCKVFALYAL